MGTFDYYSFRIKNVRDKINREIEFYQNCGYYGIFPITTYVAYLRSRIGVDKIQSTTMTQYDNMGNKLEIKKMNLDEYAKDMDILVFNKPWNKLKEFHKIMKIKEHVDSLKYGKKVKPSDISKNRERLKRKICDGLKTKKFGKNKSEVVYDQDSRTIVSISCLEYNKKTGMYEIDWEA